jgi:hypothetical protein
MAVVVAAVVVMLWPRPTQVTRASCDRIRVGMSRTEVEAILGGPPGDYRTGPTVGPEFDQSFRTVVHSAWTGPLPPAPTSVMPLPTIKDWPPIEPLAYDTWQRDAGNVYVTFSPEGVVRIKSFSAAIKLEHGPLDNLLWRLKRQWRRWFL